MRKLVIASCRTCSLCKYHIGYISGQTNNREKGNRTGVACNYLEIKKHSRIFENGKMAYDKMYCDKFEPGIPENKAWTTDNMTAWILDDDAKRKLWKELSNYGY